MWTDINTGRPSQSILEDMRDAAIERQGRDSVAPVLVPLATLLTKLSISADASARTANAAATRLELLTRRLYVATILLLIITALLFAIEVLEFLTSHPELVGGPNQQHQNQPVGAQYDFVLTE